MELDIVTFFCEWIGRLLPFECMQMRFMQTAMLGLLLIAPMAAIAGTQVVNFRMAFFSDAIGHSAFAGVAFGLLLAVSPNLTMPLLAVIVGLGIMSVKQRSGLSTDTIIGVFFSAVVAAGLAVVSRYPQAARDMQMFLYGDILTISDREIAAMFLLLTVFLGFQLFSFNKLICIGFCQGFRKALRLESPTGKSAPDPYRTVPVSVCCPALAGGDPFSESGRCPAGNGNADHTCRRRAESGRLLRQNALVFGDHQPVFGCRRTPPFRSGMDANCGGGDDRSLLLCDLLYQPPLPPPLPRISARRRRQAVP